MKRLRMQPKESLRGTIHVPGDKSISHRAVMLAGIAEGVTRVEGFLPGADCLATIACFRKMGVEIIQESDTVLSIKGKGWEGLTEPVTVLDVGNSGTTIRLMLGILAGRSFYATVAGDASIGRRPMDRVIHPLQRMGAHIEGRKGGRYTPLGMRGGALEAITYSSPIASAQVKSALLLAGLQAEGVTTITEPTTSRDHTERMLTAFGVDIRQGNHQVSIRGGQRLTATNVQVPGDISSAAFIIAAALIVPNSKVTIRNVGLNPTRTGLLDALHAMEAQLDVVETGVWCQEPVGDITVYHSSLQGTVIEGDLIPRLIDEIPILSLIATQATGQTVVRDAAELKVKETNRIAVTAAELAKVGAHIEETEDGLIIEGATPLTGSVCHSHGDHRIGMTMAVAGLIATGGVEVEDAEAINVSFPGFASLLSSL